MKPWKIVSVAAIALTACVAMPHAASAQRAHVHVVIPFGPPPPPVVVVPPAPYPGAVWGDGYYRYEGGRHVWRDGRWHHGRPGWHRAPRMWHREGHGWIRVPGGWVRD